MRLKSLAMSRSRKSRSQSRQGRPAREADALDSLDVLDVLGQRLTSPDMPFDFRTSDFGTLQGTSQPFDFPALAVPPADQGAGVLVVGDRQLDKVPLEHGLGEPRRQAPQEHGFRQVAGIVERR